MKMRPIDVLNNLKGHVLWPQSYHLSEDEARTCIEALEQQKTGHWMDVNKGKWNTIPAYKCSACKENADLRDWSGRSPFCPWCGAKMIEPQERSEE